MAKGQDADLAERRVRAPVEAADAVEVPEELIRTIEQMDDHLGILAEIFRK
jgi:hypothetical protein